MENNSMNLDVQSEEQPIEAIVEKPIEQSIETIEPIDEVEENENQFVDISRVARDNKFKCEKDEFLYNKSYVQKLRIFVKCYRFIYNLNNTIDREFEHKDRIKIFLEQLKQLYVDSSYLIEKYDLYTNYGKHRLEYKIIEIVKLNLLEIDNLIDFVNPMGKRLDLYDPDDGSVGYL